MAQRNRRQDLQGMSDEKVVDVCVGIMNGKTFSEIAEECSDRWASIGSPFKITREQVYRILKIAVDRGFFRLSPPLNETLGEQIGIKYGHTPTDIKVVSVRKELEPVASASARIVLKLIQILGARKKNVHIGLGAGRTTKLFARHLAAELRGERNVPALTLHAISTGFDPFYPQNAPIAFFGGFQNVGHDISYVGLFAPPAVPVDAYEKAKASESVKKAIKASKEIDIVVTALGCAVHKHGDLNRYLEVAGGSGLKALERRGYVGDVQFCAYSASGPINITSGERPVTLFELTDLKRLASTRNKYVVLISGPCGECRKPRTKALLPLIENPELKVWTHLVVDLDTAAELAA